MTHLIGVCWASGCERSIIPLLRAQYKQNKLVVIDDGQAPDFVDCHEVLKWANFRAFDADEKAVSIVIADSGTRRTLADKFTTIRIPLIESGAGSVVQMYEAILKVGARLSPFAMPTSNVRIGRRFHANLYS